MPNTRRGKFFTCHAPFCAAACSHAPGRTVVLLAAYDGMTTSDWVFVRGEECMRVTRSSSAAREIVIQGPGNLRRVGSFGSEGEMQEFQLELFSRLLDDGWVLERPLTH